MTNVAGNDAGVTGSSTRVMFVCLGNICRSPTAHGVFEGMVKQRNLQHEIEVASSGTGDWHIGHAPDKRATEEARRRGYDLGGLRAQQIEVADFYRFEYILAMDDANLTDLQAMQPSDCDVQLALFLSFSAGLVPREVPDPYYGGDDGFGRVFDMIEKASDGLLEEICRARAAQ